MAELEIRTRGGADPKGKPRVYITAHPKDAGKYVEEIAADLIEVADCAVYYTRDMRLGVDEEDYSLEFEMMNLVVVPVTYSLLTLGCRAMDFDIPFAKKKSIPVLPLMMEKGLDSLYSSPDRFGAMQYLSPHSRDKSEIAYKDRLRSYLKTVLVDDNLSSRIRAAFDAYVFLSYRKRDRVYANRLMRLIHEMPECRDIAIWYDEFLTPGESFSDNIWRALDNSRLFALLVTPNVLEASNFVMREEYPEARRRGMEIIPAEMVKTDRRELERNYEGIPECVNAESGELFRHRMALMAKRIATAPKKNDHTHNFLIGLAYLEGIDVEVDRERALKLITSAAEGGLPEAMEKLSVMYREGVGVGIDYKASARWQERLAARYLSTLGSEHSDTVAALGNLAVIYSELGMYEKAREQHEKVYAKLKRLKGELSSDALIVLNNLASTLGELGEGEKAYELFELVYEKRKRLFGERQLDTVMALGGVASAHASLGNYEKAITLYERVYEDMCHILGKEHGYTLATLGNISVCYGNLGNLKKAVELDESIYKTSRKAFGDFHPDTLDALQNLAVAHLEIKEYKKAYAMLDKVVKARASVLGEDHPNTLFAISSLAESYRRAADFKRERDTLEALYPRFVKTFGKEHGESLECLENLALCYSELGDKKRAADLLSQVVEDRMRINGAKNRDSALSASRLAAIYRDMGEVINGLSLSRRAYDSAVLALGEDHPDTLSVLYNYSVCCIEAEDFASAAEALLLLYKSEMKLYKDEKHPDLIRTVRRLSLVYNKLSDYVKAKYYAEKLYSALLATRGEEDEECIEALRDLFVYSARQEGDKSATDTGERLYKLMCKVKGKDHPETLTAYNNLAMCYADHDGDFKRAADIWEEIFAKYTVKKGKKHEDTLGVLMILATTHKVLGNTKRAAELQLTLVDTYRHMYGQEHDKTVLATKTLAAIYSDAGEYDRAKPLYRQVYDYYEFIKGDTHEDTLEALCSLADTVAALGDSKSAVKLHERLGVRLLEVRGMEDINTLYCFYNLARDYFELGNIEDARELCEDIYERIGGLKNAREYYELYLAEGLLSKIYGRLGMRDASLKMAKEAYEGARRLLGNTDDNTILLLQELIILYGDFGENKKALEYIEILKKYTDLG